MEPGIWHGGSSQAAREKEDRTDLRSMTWNDDVRSVSNLKLPNTPEPGAASSIWFASNERKFSVLETQSREASRHAARDTFRGYLNHFFHREDKETVFVTFLASKGKDSLH